MREYAPWEGPGKYDSDRDSCDRCADHGPHLMELSRGIGDCGDSMRISKKAEKKRHAGDASQSRWMGMICK